MIFTFKSSDLCLEKFCVSVIKLVSYRIRTEETTKLSVELTLDDMTFVMSSLSANKL